MNQSNNKRLRVIGVPSDLGQGRRGVDMGPSAIRYAGLSDRLKELGYEVQDLGNIDVPTPESRVQGLEKLKYLDQVRVVCDELRVLVRDALQEGFLPIVLGGDHSLSIGSVAGAVEARGNLGCIWFDAHGDMNTDETTPSGNIHGMPLAASLGLGHTDLVSLGGFSPKLQAKNVVLVGARSIDDEERRLIRESGMHVFTMADVDEMGISVVMHKAIELASQGTKGVHLSVDLDALDPMYAPGVGTAVNGGFTYREGHLAMEVLAASGCVTSVDFVEVNPILDLQNRTGQMAVELASSLLGLTVM
ncbi:arginase [Sulfoacidibacillus ferrooxidans]|uniref:Arginase n=1 Tax=Sulfoacidibacillus ferrooxidans TaxID=2005001 RepID=A0A9X2ADT1_9BACL|nr:arginase [Sulfoacidibacillus ferrooxidans]MCI0183805.1 Arginase [Sulfoacidibacillus ferrooxidans]